MSALLARQIDSQTCNKFTLWTGELYKLALLFPYKVVQLHTLPLLETLGIGIKTDSYHTAAKDTGTACHPDTKKTHSLNKFNSL